MSFATKTREKISFPKKDITYIAGRQSELNYQQVVDLIQAIEEETLKNTTEEMIIWIDTKVAKRTGKLRRDLKLELSSSYIRNLVLRLKLGTHIDYAKFVDEMTTAQVRHFGQKGYAYYGGKHGIVWLNDPQAIGAFFNKMLLYAKERLYINLAKAKALYLGGMSSLSKLIKFRVK